MATSQASMVVRIAANLTEFHKNLADGTSQIEKTTAGMQKLVDSFKGERLIQHANNMAAAVRAMGEEYKPTEAEAARINRTMEAAIEKYRSLGKEAPKALQDLADATRKAEPPTSFLSSTVGKLTAGFSAALIVDRVVSAIGNFAREAFQSAGTVLDLSAKTGLSTRAIQQMEHAAKLTGTSLDTFTNAAFKLGTNLAGGSQSVEAAVRALGLSYEQLRAQSPDKQFQAIAERLYHVEDAQQRNKLAVELFGRAAKDVLPAIAQNYAEIAEGATIAGENRLKALDAAADALDSATLAAKNLSVMILGSLVMGLQAVYRTFADTTANALSPFTFALEKAADTARVFGLISTDVPKVQGPATLALRQTGEAAKALSLSHEEMERIEKQLAVTVREGTEARRGNTVRLQEARTAVEPFTGLVSRSIGETAKLSRELERWAFQNGAVYNTVKQVTAAVQEQIPAVEINRSAWEQFRPAVTSSLSGGEQATKGFWDTLKGAFTGKDGAVNALTLLQGAATRMSGGFGAALQLGSAAARAFAGDWSGVVQLAGQYMDKLVEWVGAGVRKIANFFRTTFGGPSAEELAGREVVQAFEANLDQMLTDSQRIEAGNEAWKKTVIALRDAYIAAGLTEQQALADAERLWASSKQGAEASRRVIAEIEANMRGAGRAAADAVDGITSAIGRLPDRVVIPIEIEGGGPGLEGFSNGSGGIRDFGKGTLAVLHGRERVQTESQMLAERRGDAGGGGSTDLAAMIDRLESVLPMALRDAVLMAGAR